MPRITLGDLVHKSAVFILALFLSIRAHGSVSAIETAAYGDSPWSFGAFSLAVANAEGYASGGTGFFTYNYATINYSVAEKQHFSFRIPFTYRSAGFDTFGERNQEQEILIDDLIVDFTNAATLLPFDTEVFSRIRYELPTGKYSMLQKTLGSFRIDLIFSKHIAKGFQLEYWPIARWNMHTQTVYENPDIDNSLSHTKRYELDQRLNLWYVPNHRLALGAFIGTEDTWFNGSKTNSTRRQRDERLAEHFVKLGPALRYNLNDNFRFIFNVANLVPLWGFTDERAGETSDLGKFKPSQTQFVLLTFMNF